VQLVRRTRNPNNQPTLQETIDETFRMIERLAFLQPIAPHQSVGQIADTAWRFEPIPEQPGGTAQTVIPAGLLTDHDGLAVEFG